jgi:hypothetical protein
MKWCLFRDSAGNCTSAPECFVRCPYSYSDSSGLSRDILSELEHLDEESIREMGKRYASRFALSDSQGLFLARNIRDVALLQSRSEQDLADFSERLYGVSPLQIQAALDATHKGERHALNALLEDAAQHFGTDVTTMKTIVRELHGEALRHVGVEL